jgi:hypothetical protein
MTPSSEQAHRFHPANRLLDQFPLPLTDGVSGVTRVAVIDGAASPLRVWKLGDMPGDVQRADRRHAIALS